MIQLMTCKFCISSVIFYYVFHFKRFRAKAAGSSVRCTTDNDYLKQFTASVVSCIYHLNRNVFVCEKLKAFRALANCWLF